MKITISKASELTQKSVATLHRHCNNGSLSFSKNEKGEKVVDIAELERSYGKLKQTTSDNHENIDQVSMREHDNQELRHQNGMLKQENDNLKTQLKDAQEREQKLFELTDRLTKQNETLMLQPPKRRRLADVLSNLFRTTPTARE